MRTNYTLNVRGRDFIFLRNHFLKIYVVFTLVFFTASATAQCPGSPPGNTGFYPTDFWRAYVYSGLDANNPPQNACTESSYKGYFDTTASTFDNDYATGSISGPNICGTYANSFSLRLRMQKTFTAGYYNFTIGGDDGVRLSVDGGTTWLISDWNYHTYQTTTQTVYLNGTTNLVFETYDQGGEFRMSLAYGVCGTTSTAPTGISGTAAICNGTSTTLTATGGSPGSLSTYEWGIGAVGSNIIPAVTSEAITVSPAVNTTYWVRRKDPAPCALTTAGVTQQVVVTPVSTAPTTISGATVICEGNSTTLTASGGTLAAGASYEWGKGAVVGVDPISGQTAAAITVTPATTTAYWVRRVNAGSCSASSGITTTVTVNTPAGDQVTYGSNSWIGYAYASIDSANPPTNTFTASYRGYLTQPETFDMNLGATPLSGANICGTYPTNFSIRFKMNKTLAAGYYTFTVGGDDGYRFSIDGGATWIISNWNDHGYTSTSTATIYLSGSTNFIIEYYERAGQSQVTFSYTSCIDFSSAPTGISGTTTICNGSSAVLTATGGTSGSLASYQWGIGTTIGNSIIAGQTGQSITVTPSTNTTYWVRRKDASPCSTTPTGGVTQLVTVTPVSTAPTSITGTTTTCGGSTTLTATGGTLVTGGTYQWGTGSIGSGILLNTTASITVTPVATTVYWVRRIDAALCNTPTGAATVTVTVNAPSTAPTSISGSLCSLSGVNLSADGGTAASGATYQWGTGTVVGSGVIAGSNSTIYVNPGVTTTYWVRRYDPSCTTYTSAATAVVTKISVAPTGISSNNATVCSGAAATLTANGATLGTGSTYQWGTGSDIGSNIISGATAQALTVNPTTQTTYWVRCIDQGSCPATSGVSYTVNIYSLSTAPTAISGGTPLCSISGVNLSADGGTSVPGATFQWGTGTVIGSNAIAGTNNTIYVNPGATTTYWVRRFDSSCNSYTAGVTNVVYKGSTGPYSVTGTSTVCPGGSTTLTATGGTLGTGSVYQWGTGSTAGDNVISGQTNASIAVTPSSQTTYWVRLVDQGPCSATAAVFYTVYIHGQSTEPTSITGNSPICYGSGGTTLYANGVTLASGGTYQWGKGTVVGTNSIAGSGSNIFVNPTTTTTYWVRSYDSNCSHYSTGVTFTVVVGTASTAPTSISGTQTICNGSGTTLTAVGGTAGTGVAYQWGTGSTAGDNIIAGSTNTLLVTPTVTTTYWVRKIDPAPCNTTTNAATLTVTVIEPSSAPTSISGAPSSSVCAGASYTLTAVGGASAPGAVYQWGKGTTIGSSIMTGQTGVSITVNPTTTTSYWVRRKDGSPCSSFTAAATTVITITAPAGNPASFISNQWTAYGYSTADIELATAIYAGYYTQSTLGIDTQNGANSWNSLTSPSSSAGWTGCPVPVDNFTMSYKRKGFPCGTYTLTMANWDDEARVYIDGTLVWSCTSYSGGNACNGNVGSFDLTSASKIEVRFKENGGNANIKLDMVKTDIASTAPTAITGTFTTCEGLSVILTAIGGTMGTNGTYQWGTGLVVGTNILDDEVNASITVNPSITTTYWVRRVDGLCGTTTSSVKQLLSVIQGTVSGAVSATNSILCRGTIPGNITLAGNVGNVVKWQSADDIAFTVNVNDIASSSTVLTGALIGPLTATKYFRAVVQSGSCLEVYTNAVLITVPEAVTYNGTWSAIPSSLTPIVISANMTLASNLNVCACQITNGAVLTIPADKSLIVSREIVVDATSNIIVENDGSIVQVEDDAIDAGIITVKRNTKPLKQYDFNYWSSPVQGLTLTNLSPNTLLDKYFSYDPMIGNWACSLYGAQVMTPGQGYIVRAPQGWSTTNASNGIYTGIFTGVPNTGVIPVTIQKGLDTFNLIGNPYPSAIDIDLFLTDPVNDNLVNGTIYLWTHNTAVTSLTYTSNDYAKYNLTGGVQTTAAPLSGGTQPLGKIASGQGFFIEANGALANGSYTANFRNYMRIANNNSQYFKTATLATTDDTELTVLEKHRLWLRLTNTEGAYSETLLGYVAGATDEWDRKFDGPILPSGNYVNLYSVMDAYKLSIQGKALPFEDTDVIPLGYQSTVASTYGIGLEHFEGVFDSQVIYLVDKTDNSYHNLKEAEYTFTSTVGTFDNRFELRFVPAQTLGTEHPVADENSVYIVRNDKHIEVSTGNYEMEALAIFDLTGKKIFEKDAIGNTLYITSDLNLAPQVLIVKVTLGDNQVISKKVIFN